LIRGVLRLGGVLVEIGNLDLFAGAVEKGDGGPLLFAELQAADDRRDGDDTNGQDVLPDEAVDKGTLAGLELAENGHVNGGILDEKALAGLDLTAQGQDLHRVAGRADPLQGLLREMLDLGQRHWSCGLFHKKTPPGYRPQRSYQPFGRLRVNSITERTVSKKQP